MSVEQSDPDVFKTTYECGNCGEEWDEQHPPRTTVEKITAPRRVTVRNEDCDSFISSDCGCCRIVSCPTCELRDSVTVNGREPLGGGQ